MRRCTTCGKRMKWSSFGTEVCSDCTKHWEGFFAEENAMCEASLKTSASESEPEFDDLDLDRLLAAVRLNDREETAVFSQVWVSGGYPAKSLAVSALLHAVAIFLLYGLSGISFQRPLSFTRAGLERDFQITYYRPSDMLPKIRSMSDGPKDPAGRKKGIKPPPGSTSYHPRQTIQSSPPKPDNVVQTIVQPSAPSLQIQQHVDVPNMVVWNVPESKVEPLDIASRQVASLVAAKLNAPAAAIRPPEPEFKNVEQNLSELTIAKSDLSAPEPKLTLRSVASPEWSLASDALNPGPLIQVDGGGLRSDLRNLVVLSANPGLPGPGGIKFPPGNKSGAFSISPEGNRPGSPNGEEGGILAGGTPGGGGSGVGDGSGYGSGGSLANIQIPGISVKGGPGDERPPLPGPGRRPRSGNGFSDMQTIDDPGDSYNITVVEGRRGGAGLGVYGVLSGKRNYTVFVPMPGGRWIMQFSEMGNAGSRGAGETEPAAFRSEILVSSADSVMQPRPIRKVDPGAPEDEELAKLRGMVVLYAVIRQDGGIDRVRVVRSLNPALDQRAVEALKQWKFRAAQLGQRPIEVQALFGVPFRPQPNL
jgi:TonB family protein